jgi:uncharacterized protein (UPF0335 family)
LALSGSARPRLIHWTHSNAIDVKVRREILRLRKQDKDERDEQDSLLDLYLRATESAGSSQAKAA